MVWIVRIYEKRKSDYSDNIYEDDLVVFEFCDSESAEAFAHTAVKASRKEIHIEIKAEITNESEVE